MTKSSVITSRLSITMAGLIIDFLFSSDKLTIMVLTYISISYAILVQGIHNVCDSLFADLYTNPLRKRRALKKELREQILFFFYRVDAFFKSGENLFSQSNLP